jgi:SAM-dependent methyltransferase
MLEQQLFSLCITDFSGQEVLDLGGGTGARTIDGLRAGAKTVDLVDISDDMMKIGREQFRSIPGADRVAWYHGDASKPLEEQKEPAELEKGSYDLVIANGIFDHAHNTAELEMMFRNISFYLKDGGTMIANRNNAFSKAARAGKYGVIFTDFQPLPQGGGMSYKYRTETDPPLVFEPLALDAYSSRSWMQIPGKFFEEFRNVPWQETPVVKEDLESWKEYLDDPILYVYTARKRGEL